MDVMELSEVSVRRRALKKNYDELLISVPNHLSLDLEVAAETLYPLLLSLLNKEIENPERRDRAFKYQLRIKIRLEKYSFDNDKIVDIADWFPSQSQIALTSHDVEPTLQLALRQCLSIYDNFVKRGSGWTLKKVDTFSLSISKFELFSGGCDNNNPRCSLPKCLQRSRSILTPFVWEKDRCLLYALACALAPDQRNPSRPCKLYQDIVSTFPVEGLSFPSTLKDVRKLEERCPLRINIFGFDKNIFPVYMSTNADKKDHLAVNLLYHEGHYYTIKNLGRLVGSKVENERKRHVCHKCLWVAVSDKAFEEHKLLCQADGQRITLPEEGSPSSRLSFTDFSSLVPVPFVAYCDLETCIEEEKSCDGGTKKLGERRHVPIVASAYVVCAVDDSLSLDPVVYMGENCIDRLLDYLEKSSEYVQDVLQTADKSLIMTAEDWASHNRQKHCFMCNRLFQPCSKLFHKVRDHCHLTGKYRHALCSRCNLTRAKYKEDLVVFFHGLSNYDSHFIVQRLDRYRNCDFRIIPRNSEKYLCFALRNMIFKDTYQFMDRSLAELVKNLREGGEEPFYHATKFVRDPNLRKLLYRKGVFPYNYVSSPSRLLETCLPDQEHFHNDLTRQPLSNEDYQHARDVFKAARCINMREYQFIYAFWDTTLLAATFENFRKRCMLTYGLDAAHYVSNAHFSFNAFLRFSNVEFDLLTDQNMYCLFNRGIRGGVSLLSKRYARANNKYMSNYDPAQESVYLLYLDCGNLYGWAMMQHVPFRNFRWLAPNEINLESILATGPEADRGYVLEVDLDYPRELHDLHSDYPLAPHKKSLSFSALSPVGQNMCQHFQLKYARGSEKLMCTVLPKKRYIVHYRTLALYLKLGMICTKVHRVVTFDQAPVMRAYIENNSHMRAQAKNSFDQDYWKLLSNALFGKTMERPDRRVKIKLHTSAKTFGRAVSKATFKSSKMINENLVATESKYSNICIRKPMYLGMTVLDLAKLRMYEFYYCVLKKFYSKPKQLQMVYTDTDSLILEIRTDDVYEDLASMSQHFDFYNYPSDHHLFSEKNKRVPGLFKDECGGQIMTEFVGLRSKMYAIRRLAPKSSECEEQTFVENKTAKGCPKALVKKDLKFDHYTDCLFHTRRMEHEFSAIRSISHRVSTVRQTKVTISPFDDKRYVLDDLISTLPHGHYSLPQKDRRKRRASQSDDNVRARRKKARQETGADGE